ncbi:MAG: hypothetical protein H7146_01245 [Burkholderiaceae bacterium]|nr:hypothetical protein [Microbacteriaceae bacterium]
MGIGANGGNAGYSPETRSGTGGSGTDGSGTDSKSGSGAGTGATTPKVCGGFVLCKDNYTVTSALQGRGPITWADLVSFRPTVGTQRMEPNGWSIVGLDTNFFATAQTEVQQGQLVGLPTWVRFTPVAYQWSYGDGSGATTSARGSSWDALKVSEFDPTGTSHAFEAPGSYTVTMSVVFRAEYSFGPPDWIPVEGTLAVPTAAQSVQVGHATTVLVGGDCRARPAGPGC